MTKLTRLTGKVFGETATATGDDPEIGQFGSALAGTYVGTTDVAAIQNLPAWSNGFIDSVTPSTQFPPLPEMTGFGKVLSYQYAYLLQKGVAEWDSGTTYYTGDFCKGVGEGKLYVSKVDSNLNHAVTDSTYWEEFSSGNSRNIGEIVTSTMPLIDAGLHLLDGSLLQYGSYRAFIDYIADLYNSGDYTAIFDTEANWQAAVTLSGVCSKFVYDSNDNTVRLPKWGNQAITKEISSSANVSVYGDGKTLGLTNGTNKITLAGGATTGVTYIFQGAGSKVGQPYSTTTTIDSGRTGIFGVIASASQSGLTGTADLSSISSPLDCYYYIVIATTTKTKIEVDIDEIATDLNGKADKDAVDGQWVNSGLSIASGVTAPTSTDLSYDISTYLPDDGRIYEVLFNMRGTTSSASNAYTVGYLYGDILSAETLLYFHRNPSNNGVATTAGGNAIIPIGSTRKIYVLASSSNTGTFSLEAIGYRRIGTNS